MAASSGWNEMALRYSEEELLEEVQTELVCRDDNLSLAELIAMAIHLENLLWKRQYSSLLSLPQ